jgi:RNA polymerase sigma-70 factor (ECF subfamily)
MTDQELLRAYIDGRDVDSLGAFLTRYQDSLLCFVAKLLGDHEAAQDVVQETFLVVARHPRRLLDVESCHNWLLRVARNLGIDHLRRLARHRRHAAAAAEQAAAEARARQDEEAAAIERDETCVRVRAAIERLKPRHRELLLLKVQEGKTYREISEITGLSVTNVGYLLHQAMKTLAARLKEEGKL